LNNLNPNKTTNERIKTALINLKKDIKEKGSRFRRKEFLDKYYPNANFWKACIKIGLIENTGCFRVPKWEWQGGRIVKGDYKFIQDFMFNASLKKRL